MIGHALDTFRCRLLAESQPPEPTLAGRGRRVRDDGLVAIKNSVQFNSEKWSHGVAAHVVRQEPAGYDSLSNDGSPIEPADGCRIKYAPHSLVIHYCYAPIKVITRRARVAVQPLASAEESGRTVRPRL